MKNFLFDVSLVLIISIFISCSNNSYSSYEKSREYFDQFISQIKDVSDDCGYSVKERFTPVTSGERTIIVNISDSEYIEIGFNNLSFKSDKTKKKTFYVDYRIEDQSKTMDMDLFLKICNVISRDKLDVEVCSEFLESDKYNVEKSSIEKVSKEKYFDFGQNSGLSYKETDFGLFTSSFSFWGYTK